MDNGESYQRGRSATHTPVLEDERIGLGCPISKTYALRGRAVSCVRSVAGLGHCGLSQHHAEDAPCLPRGTGAESYTGCPSGTYRIY